MRFNKITIVTIAPSILSTASFGQSQVKQPTTSKSILPMPVGFTDISLGMDIHDFVKIHPHAERFSLMDGPKPIDLTRPNQALIEEKLQTPIFSDGLFYFNNCKLDVVVLGSPSEGICKNDVEKFLTSVISLYGQPDEYAVVEYRRGKQIFSSTGIYWHSNSTLIGASIPPLDVNGQIMPGAVSLKVALTSKWQEEQLYRHRHLKKADEEKVLAPARALIAHLLKKLKS